MLEISWSYILFFHNYIKLWIYLRVSGRFGLKYFGFGLEWEGRKFFSRVPVEFCNSCFKSGKLNPNRFVDRVGLLLHRCVSGSLLLFTAGRVRVGLFFIVSISDWVLTFAVRFLIGLISQKNLQNLC